FADIKRSGIGARAIPRATLSAGQRDDIASDGNSAGVCGADGMFGPPVKLDSTPRGRWPQRRSAITPRKRNNPTAYTPRAIHHPFARPRRRDRAPFLLELRLCFITTISSATIAASDHPPSQNRANLLHAAVPQKISVLPPCIVPFRDTTQ